MKKLSIPNTDLSLSFIGLGTVKAGIHWDGAEANNLFDAYLDMGGNVIDTARVYSNWIPPETGRSERVIGDWITKSGKRDKIILMTKGGHPKFTSPDDDLTIPRMTAADMRMDIELSLKALRTDTIDIYFYHRDNRQQSVEEEIEVMETFKKEGKLRYYACSNWKADRILDADAYCKQKGYRGFVADQALFNAGVQYMNPPEDETLVSIRGKLYEYHKNHVHNLAVPYTGIAGGFFHKYTTGGEAAVKDSPYFTPQNIKIAQKCTALMNQYNASLSQVLLGFFMCQPFACMPLYGPRNIQDLQDAMQTSSIPFKKEDYIF